MKRRSLWGVIGWSAYWLLATLALLGFFAAQWAFDTWANIQMEELIFLINSPVGGTSSELVMDGVMSIALPAVVILAAMMAALLLLKKKCAKWLPAFVCISMAACTALLAAALVKAWNELELGQFIQAQSQDSKFIEEHYVDPGTAEITFEEKKNLIYVFLESMETTFADKDAGGAFEENVIPELTQLALQGEDFSGASHMLNGALVMPGATWTMGAMFAHTSGLPLQVTVGGNDMGAQDHFFKDMVALGDVLDAAGYQQTLMVGSDATFGGRALYFKEHGGYDIQDYYSAITDGKLPANYYVWWGYEDKKLFDYAKEEITRLAAEEEPFNFTLLTVDTHFEDGWVCEDCQNQFDNDQYSNVYACASRQAAAFVSWVQQQEFYEDTVVVLVGDHLTMDGDYCAQVDSAYQRRVYTSVINADKQPVLDESRIYSTFDLFPTTLSAMGARIEGDRLGLGTNLFSAEKTLLERYARAEVEQQLRSKSAFMENLANIQVEGTSEQELRWSADGKSVELQLHHIDGIETAIRRVELEYWQDNETLKQTMELSLGRDGSYRGRMQAGHDSYVTYRAYAECENGQRYQIAEYSGNLWLAGEKDLDTYLDKLKELQHHTVLIGVADEASSSMTLQTQAKFAAWGLKADWSDAFRSSYYAVLENGVPLHEKMGKELLVVSGKFPDGAAYSLTSAGYNNGSKCSILIDGTEYARNQRGLNFVVYDHANSRVVHSTVFDTYAASHGDAVVEVSLDLLKRNLTFKVSDIQGLGGNVKAVEVAYWHENNGKQTLKLTQQGDSYQGSVPVNKDAYVAYRIYAIDEDGDREKVADAIKNPALVVGNLSGYLAALKELEHHAVLIAVADEASSAMPEKVQEALEDWGLQEDWVEAFRCSYYAVLENNVPVQEDMSTEMLTTQGVFPDGTAYTVLSAGYDCGNRCSIRIGGTEYAGNKRGLNFVVYDYVNNCVVESTVFDTSVPGNR